MSPGPADDRPGTAAWGLVEAITAITTAGDRAGALQHVVEHGCRLTGVHYGTLLVVDSLGRPSEMFHHGTDVEAVSLTGLVGTPVTVRGHTYGLLYLADHDDGSPLTAAEDAAVRALVSVAGYVLDHGRSHQEAERRRVWQNHAAALSSTLQPPFGLSNADRTVAEVAMRAAGGVSSTVARPVDGEMLVTATCGDPPAWDGSDEHEAAVHAVLDGSAAEAEAGHDHVVLLAPMNTHFTAAGALAVYFPVASPPDDVEMDLLSEFTEQAALALDRARAFQEREQMALVTDRDRIARELHDVVIQRLFATGLHLQKSRSLATEPELRDRLSLSMQELDQIIRAIRGSIFDLQHGPRSSLRSELRDVLTEYVDQLGFIPAVRTDGPIDQALPGPAQKALTEVLRQALSNVADARASSATVQVHLTSDELVLEVHDDGKGLDPGAQELSLASLRLALRTQGCTLDVGTSESDGSTLTCRIPLD